MKICKNCNSEVKNDQRFCANCGYDTLGSEVKKDKKLTIAIIVVFIVAIIGLVIFSFKDNIAQAYYIKKGDSEKASSAIEYYIKALEIEYSDEVVSKIHDKINESDDPEKEIESVEKVLERKDLEKIYIEVYVDKAKENFNKENYKTSRKYLDMAKDYNYDVATFEYYEDLEAIEKEELDKIQEEKLAKANEEKEQEKEKETVYVVENNHYSYNYDTSYSNDYGYFIIPDSNTRYLTEDELLSYTKSQLGYIRNEIFARYGYIFKNNVYKDYFNSMPWYYPDSTFSGSIGDLNEVEQYNVNLIKSLE